MRYSGAMIAWLLVMVLLALIGTILIITVAWEYDSRLGFGMTLTFIAGVIKGSLLSDN